MMRVACAVCVCIVCAIGNFVTLLVSSFLLLSFSDPADRITKVVAGAQFTVGVTVSGGVVTWVRACPLTHTYHPRYCSMY